MNQLDTYTGIYTSTSSDLNTTLTLTRRLHYGLLLTHFISNGTDVLGFLRGSTHTRFQLAPTLLNVDEKKEAGERWRVNVVDDEPPNLGVVWEDGMCVTDVDVRSYAGLPLNEMVFWRDERGEVIEVGLTAYRVRLRKVVEEDVHMEVFDGDDWGGQSVVTNDDEL